MVRNLVLPEATFDEFRRFCRGKGFDLSYVSAEISGSREEIADYQFDRPKVINLRRRPFGFQGMPYDVAEWQQEKWDSSLPEIEDEFSSRRPSTAKVDSFWFGSIAIAGKKYTRDVLLFPDGSVRQRKGGLWKFGSHLVKEADIDELVKAKPEVLIVGTGTKARARVATEVEGYTREANVELLVAPSAEAIKHLNQLMDEGKHVSALIHITC